MLIFNHDQHVYKFNNYNKIWRSPSLSVLTPMIFRIELTQLGLKIFILNINKIMQIIYDKNYQYKNYIFHKKIKNSY